MAERGHEFGPYARTLCELGQEHPEVVALVGDLTDATEVSAFAERFPQRYFNIGMAEQNMMGIAAGMAFEGDVPFVHSFGVFVTRRAYDQLAIAICYHNLSVKLIGTIPGLTSRLGPTHQAIEDVALMRHLPNMTVIDPADAVEIRHATRAAFAHPGPVYLRMQRREVPVLHDETGYRFEIGKAIPMAQGTDVILISTGLMLAHVLDAHDVLAREHVSAGILHVPTIKPLDSGAITSAAAATGALVTVENPYCGGRIGERRRRGGRRGLSCPRHSRRHTGPVRPRRYARIPVSRVWADC